jgi:hypothetical protein
LHRLPPQEALALCPGVTWVSVLLVQLLLVSGRVDAALQAARAATAAAPRDADAAKLLALVLQQQLLRQEQRLTARGQACAGAAHRGGGDAASDAAVHALRDECLRSVQLDPWAYGALSGEGLGRPGRGLTKNP